MNRRLLWAVFAIGLALVIVPFAVDNYRQVNSLPDFRLFTVFFVVPGVLLILIAGYGLFREQAPGAICLPPPRPPHARMSKPIPHPLPDDLVELIARALPRPERADEDQAARPVARGRGDCSRTDRARSERRSRTSPSISASCSEAGSSPAANKATSPTTEVVDEGIFSLCEAVCGRLHDEAEALRELVTGVSA